MRLLSQLASLRAVIATAEVLLQPAIEGDEQVANLPISLILSFSSLTRRLRQVMGITVQEYPRTMVFNGSSTVRLKCGERNGRQPSITVLR